MQKIHLLITLNNVVGYKPVRGYVYVSTSSLLHVLNGLNTCSLFKYACIHDATEIPEPAKLLVSTDLDWFSYLYLDFMTSLIMNVAC